MRSNGSVHLVDALYDGVAIPILRAVLPAVASAVRAVQPRLQAWSREEQHTRDRLAVPAATSGPRCWIHAASVGELEQLLPIVREIRERRPEVSVVATVTSISAIDHARQSPLLDDALLLPVDHLPTMRRLVAALQPTAVVINRYDLWRSMIRALHEARVPMVLVNATAPTKAHHFLVGAWLTDTYRQLTEILAISEHHAERLHQIASHVPVSVVPDSRVDQVLYRLHHRTPAQDVSAWIPHRDYPTVIVGSAWPADLDLLASALQELPVQPRLVIVPHQLRESEVVQTCLRFDALRYSTDQPDPSRNVVVDAYGLLVGLYPLGTAAWVGGGFGAGVHSTTEPACAGLPIACGPNIHRSLDAQSLQQAGSLAVITSVQEARDWLRSQIVLAVGSVDTRSSWLEERLGASATAAVHVLKYLS